jgi:hypothetical protein
MTLAPELRELIIAHKAELIAYLSIWSSERAIALEHEADSLVEALGVPGTDRLIQAAAARCVEAHQRRDMADVRRNCHMIEDRARLLRSEMDQNKQGDKAA